MMTTLEENIQEALREVRLALLEADVNFKVVKGFIERVRVKAIGQDVLTSLGRWRDHGAARVGGTH